MEENELKNLSEEEIREEIQENEPETAETVETAAEETVTAEETVESDESEETEESEQPPLTNKEKVKKILKDVGSTLLTILIAVVVALLLNIYVIRISNINGNSMLPTYTNGQTVVMSRIPYIFSKPQYNDIVIFDSENTGAGERTFLNDLQDTVEYNAITMYVTKTASTQHKFWIKRVIGLPGDVLEIKDQRFYRNGELLEEDYINEQNWMGGDMTWTVSEGCVFVMGDNRNHSSDSRYIGEISYDAILGKVLTEGNKKE